MASRGTQGRKGRTGSDGKSGKLRIGDNWNAITIIALSQSNPLKAIAEFVENSIDARARNITIVRGKDRGDIYLKVIDDGEGIPLNSEGVPDFKYVATHICDSIKKRLKNEGIQGIQGEFGIGLLSFWTIGERLILSSAGADGKTYQMEMQKGDPGYTIRPRRTLFSHGGTELVIQPLLPGIRKLNGERMQSYLASELRDRIRTSGVDITVKDRHSRKEFKVEPRQYTGRLLHQFGARKTRRGEVYLELYLNAFDPANTVSLFRSGTRVLPSLSQLDDFSREPWTSGYLQGMVDGPFLQLTPGTRSGIVHDERLEEFARAVQKVEPALREIIELEKKAEEEETSRKILKSVQRALREAILNLPPEEYDWFDVHKHVSTSATGRGQGPADGDEKSEEGTERAQAAPSDAPRTDQQTVEQREFYEYPGPLYKVKISPASSVIMVGTSREFRCVPRDRGGRIVDQNLSMEWEITSGGGALTNSASEVVTFNAPDEPGLTMLRVSVTQNETTCEAEATVTISQSLLDKDDESSSDLTKGIPGYTFQRAPGERWRSRFDEKNNLIVVNNGHSDYLFASKKRPTKLKYICRLYAKELVLRNFPGFESGELLERMIELSLYTEEYLK